MKEVEISHEIESTARIDINSLREEANLLLKYYEQTIAIPQEVDIGPVSQLRPLYASEMPPLALREYKIHYPKSLIEAYKIACEKYDQQLMKLVEGHKILSSDYQYAPHTLAFQVDGPAYSDEFLKQAEFMEPAALAGFIVRRVFEFETNIAAYALNGRLWPDGNTNETWHATLENVRKSTGKKVAVLAGTEQKLDEMLMYEMGVTRSKLPAPEIIRLVTGFDALFGPNDLVSIYEQHKGKDSPYVFFGRASRPKSWLCDPASRIDEGFWGRPEMLKYVRAYSLTHNFDDPKIPTHHSAAILDTKEALVMIGAAYLVTKPSDIYSEEFLRYLANNNVEVSDIANGTLTQSKKNKLGGLFLNFPSTFLLSESLINHLQARGSDVALIASGAKKVRVKPLKQHYGIYGHETGQLNRAKFLNELMGQIRSRGYYVLQPEFKNLQIIDSVNPTESYVAIDRVFLVRKANGELQPMESCRSLMPAQLQEGRANNVHEGAHTKCARIAI